ncbi:hypothetical protein JNJ66_04130 [Candidatus Saccharibacteria bacterium]|nr:hypothetical protein [Candidatus Saccharibacteria bacterium]
MAEAEAARTPPAREYRMVQARASYAVVLVGLLMILAGALGLLLGQGQGRQQGVKDQVQVLRAVHYALMQQRWVYAQQPDQDSQVAQDALETCMTLVIAYNGSTQHLRLDMPRLSVAVDQAGLPQHLYTEECVQGRYDDPPPPPPLGG